MGLGLAIEERSIDREEFRYGYQGDFAEKDEETGWNSFEFRMYDGGIGRWMTTDPAGQYYSSYLDMGHNPVSLIDPDGSFSKFGAWWRNGFRMNGVCESGGEWGYSRSFTYTDHSEFGTLTAVGYEFIYQSDGLSFFRNVDVLFCGNVEATGSYGLLSYGDIGVSGYKIDLLSTDVINWKAEAEYSVNNLEGTYGDKVTWWGSDDNSDKVAINHLAVVEVPSIGGVKITVH